MYQRAVQSDQEDRFAVRQLLDKAIGLLSTKDPIAFQQVQAMNPIGDQLSTAIINGFDPTDSGEFLREAMRGEYDYTADGASTEEEVREALAELGIER